MISFQLLQTNEKIEPDKPDSVSNKDNKDIKISKWEFQQSCCPERLKNIYI